MRPDQLPAHWRAHADTLAAYGATESAAVVRRLADELEAALRAAGDELLDLATASKESGMSASRLRHMVAEGTIPNAGRKGAPRIKRSDLPRRRARAATAANGFDPSATAAAMLRGRFKTGS